jgi:putative alpha-1,2-mannosidase
MDGGCAPEPFYELGSPIFNRVTIRLNSKYYKGKQFIISTKGNSSDNMYIQSASLNGNSLNSWVVPHQTIVNGGELILEMGNRPMTSWGVASNK